MTKTRTFTIEHLWTLMRLGAPSLSPDGRTVVSSVSTPSMKDNRSPSALWLLSMDGGAPKRLTHSGDADAHPRFSPRGDNIAFVAKREQEGQKDDTPQLYAIAPDGGEARRLGRVATGVDGFRWFPDGERLAFVSWVWPDEKGSKAQAKRLQAFKDRKETGYATSQLVYRYWDRNLPMQRVPHVLLMDVKSGKVRDLFEGTPYELTRAEPDEHCFDISPDGKRLVFAFDPAKEKQLDHTFSLAELEIKSGRIRVVATDADWDFAHPVYHPDGTKVALIASHQGLKHTMPGQLAVLDLVSGRWDVVSAEWDHAVEGPLRWSDDGDAVLLLAEQQGRRHVWRFDCAARRAEMLVQGAWVDSFDLSSGAVVSVMHAATYPARMHAHVPGQPPLRIETFNDAALSQVALGRVEERWIEGASGQRPTPPSRTRAGERSAKAPRAPGDRVQVWMTYPSGFDDVPKNGKKTKRWPLLHVIHGGPHTSFGDAWHTRWNTQVLAAQGYVVACVNYHGSTGFGYASTDSITHRWAELELQDIEAATDTLLREPWADPQRVYAAGGSYGGYMVAWMNGRVAPGRYAAYVCHAGCYDWQAMMADDAYTWFHKELGAKHWDDPAKVASQSPITYAGSMHTPTLVIHGALDYRVPDAQGLAYYNTLRARGVDARLLWFADENHWILKPRNSQQWYGEFFDWLKRHDPVGKRSGVKPTDPSATPSAQPKRRRA